MSIAVVGSLGLDTIKTPLGKAERVLGGSASYFSYTASLFSAVNLIAVVGEDFPKDYMELLNRKNISLKGVQRVPGKTFNWSGEYYSCMSNPKTKSVELGVFAGFNPEVPSCYKKSNYIFLANIDPRLQKETIFKLKTRKSQIVACDTMNFWIENSKKELLNLLKLVDIFFLNEFEARQITQESNLLKAIKAMVNFGPKKIFIKRGEYGVLLSSGKRLFSIPAYPLSFVADPTGAGDTFAGAAMGYLASVKKMNFESLQKAAAYGVVAATFAVEDFSLGGLKKATLPKLEKRLKEFRKLISF